MSIITINYPKKIIYSIIFYLAIGLSACTGGFKDTVMSPDGKIKIQVSSEDGQIYYAVSKSDKPILNRSLLGFVLQDSDLYKGLTITDVTFDSFNETWEQVWGEERFVTNHYNEMKLSIQEAGGMSRRFDLLFRVFNDGFGFRYEFPEQENLNDFVIMDELTEFALAGNHKAWSIPYDIEAYEGLYRPSSINALDTVCTPLTMETSDGLFLAIHEANLTDYAAMNLHPRNDGTTLKCYLTPWSTGEKVFMKAPHVTPWRTMIIADNEAGLLLSRLMLNLNEPNRIEDTSWIQPGRYIGIWWGMHMKEYTWETGPKHGATTANTKRYIDFASKHGFDGVLVEGWNKGWEDWRSFSFTESYPDFDMVEVTRYGAEKGVKLIGHHETGGWVSNYEPQMEEAFTLYRDHGVNAVKTGYVGTFLDGKEMHSGQFAVNHYRKVIETAVKYRLMIDNHEPVMPTGLQRTYPNLMTLEGVRGQEWDAWSNDGGNPPEHTTIIPFTRGLAGPMDFTPGTFNFTNKAMPGTRVQTTLAKQLALFVVLFSPLQMASDMIENYEANPAPFEFITQCPANWSETVVAEAKIGEYVTIARKDRNSENWFAGSITAENAREMFMQLDFLDKGVTYKARIFKDGKGAHYETDPYTLNIEEIEVTADSVLVIKQAPGGGTAIIFTKKDDLQ